MTVANEVLDLLAEMTHAKHDVGHTLVAEPRQLVRHKRCASDREQGLRNGGGAGMHARRQAACQNRNGIHQSKRTFVPSKLKRNLTSSSPAFAIACRSRR